MTPSPSPELHGPLEPRQKEGGQVGEGEAAGSWGATGRQELVGEGQRQADFHFLNDKRQTVPSPPAAH